MYKSVHVKVAVKDANGKLSEKHARIPREGGETIVAGRSEADHPDSPPRE